MKRAKYQWLFRIKQKNEFFQKKRKMANFEDEYEKSFKNKQISNFIGVFSELENQQLLFDPFYCCKYLSELITSFDFLLFEENIDTVFQHSIENKASFIFKVIEAHQKNKTIVNQGFYLLPYLIEEKSIENKGPEFLQYLMEIFSQILKNNLCEEVFQNVL